MRGRSHIRHDAVHRYGLIGLVVMGVLGALIFLSYRTDNGLPWQSHYEIHADVADATRIVHHDEVRIGGVRVGQVTSVTAMRAHGTGQPFARLALSLDKSVGRLPSDTRVHIGSASLLGRSYVELEPGHSARTIPPGGGIGQRRVIPTVDMQDLLDVFDRATARATRGVIGGLGYGFAGRGQDFNRALDPRARQQIWQKLQELVFTEGGWAKTGDFFYVRLRSKTLEGYVPVGIGMIVWNLSVAK